MRVRMRIAVTRPMAPPRTSRAASTRDGREAHLVEHAEGRPLPSGPLGEIVERVEAERHGLLHQGVTAGVEHRAGDGCQEVVWDRDVDRLAPRPPRAARSSDACACAARGASQVLGGGEVPAVDAGDRRSGTDATARATSAAAPPQPTMPRPRVRRAAGHWGMVMRSSGSTVGDGIVTRR